MGNTFGTLLSVLVACLLWWPAPCKADEPERVLTSVRAYQGKDRVWCEVRIENNSTESIEARRMPAALSFTEVSEGHQATDDSGERTARVKGWGCIFRDEDQLTIRLRPNETFIKKIDITSRVRGHSGKFTVTASWPADQKIPKARQNEPVELGAAGGQ